LTSALPDEEAAEVPAEQLEKVPEEPEEVPVQLTQSELERLEKEQYISSAIAKFDIHFFKQFLGETRKETQLNIEKFIANAESDEDVNGMLVSMINQSYELNGFIANSQDMVYRIFTSPLSTIEQRKVNENGVLVSKDKGARLLLGNIFAERNMQLSPIVYHDMLETVAINQKKKHFKKIVEYIQKYETSQSLKP